MGALNGLLRSRAAMKRLLPSAAVVLLACSADAVTRAEWQRMTAGERELYVRSLIGAEQVKEAKGGGGRDYGRAADEYVAEIDSAYARGDRRNVEEIFAGLEPPR